VARGWESKAVADQMESALERDEERNAAVDALGKDRERRVRLESLRLSKSRTLQQLERATHPMHREMLQRTLQAVEAEVDKVAGGG
jgi:hypothetical protein